ncbi:hybrid sensor histidine kinase/response regulator [Niabella drilacis]|uniref:histidine kinase n=1 Tax=Niabella drilacis (strain DSM 25811 / CCM 8410 / CCUG 62505 / LMG 26954 / E90) TaxID=1285928 RepID=A0A1G7AGR9_NIADE|nr:hybrid sensor histidine kinase/response regulator [Niabella drilacis]SDE13972.1 Signal transduction histidine kinase [Niabella drilacis]
MKSSFRYILVVTFIAAVIVIVFLQFNSSQSINQLINGNEDLMNVLKLKMELQQVQENVTQLETEVKSIVIRGHDLRDGRFEQQAKKVSQSFRTLDSFEINPVIGAGILQLKRQVNKKIALNKEVLRTFAGDGKEAAEALINDQEEALLSDSIRSQAHRVDRQYQVSVTQLIRNADRNGRNAKAFGTILAVIAAVASLLAFGYISYKMGEQQRLIDQLNASEQRARRSAEAKENFLANMSHEIRTPLNAILGFTGLLQKKQGDPEAAQYTDLIHKAGENLLQIVNNILDISKIEAGMMPVEKAVFDLRETVATIEHLYRQRSEEKGLSFAVQVADDVPELVEGDPVRLTQIIVNLVSNAIKFTERGSVTVTVTLEQAMSNKMVLAFVVSDTGMGMDAAARAVVFNRFRQGDESITRKYGGTGLGLTIVKDLVQLQGGSMEVTGEKGTGTVFTVRLPFGWVSGGQKKERDSALLKASPAGWRHKSVLVVEDNEMNRLLLAQLLKSWNIGFDMVSNGSDGLRLLKEKPYDLVLMDIQMPEMDGYTATAEIRNTLRSTVPVVAMTADALTSQKDKCLQAGMNDYISKPLDEAVLHRLLVQLLEVPAAPAPAAETPAGIPAQEYLHYLQLDYLFAVSRGNREYEKDIMEQFCEMVPEELAKIQRAWEQGNAGLVRRTAHSMRTTVAALGLTPHTEAYLLALEHIAPADPLFAHTYKHLKEVCRHALEEAAAYYAAHYG